MAELEARGPDNQEWREPLRTGARVCLGRAPRSGWRVPWDNRISREHAILQFDGIRLRVQRLQSARNKIYYREEPSTDFEIDAGEEFRIGATNFRLVVQDSALDERTADPDERATFDINELVEVQFGNADRRLESLSHLPELIAKCTDDTDFAERVVRLILEAVPVAEGAAAVKWADAADKNPLTMRSETRHDDPNTAFRPSRRLMIEALNRGEAVAHSWVEVEEESAIESADGKFTLSGDMDWAFCVPVTGEACEGWCLYVSGRIGHPIARLSDLKGDMRFVQLVGQFLGAIGRVLQLEKQRAGMARFFSPVVVESLKHEMRNVSFSDNARDHHSASRLLVPREGNITVLFCDLRGFSRQTEMAEENLRQLMARVSEALGVMTMGILRHDGVVADFIGDAALGFWGWPEPVEDGPLRACRAATAILRGFHEGAEEPDSPLAGFRIGIGIAHGPAIAGRIGTREQAKVDVFGPVVNIGARIEGMTKLFRSQVLIDETTAEYVRDRLRPQEGRLRRLAKVRPAGMETPVTVTELLPPEGTLGCHVPNQSIDEYHRALDDFEDGRWSEALDTLDGLPVQDRVKHFLMVHIANHDYAPPQGWDGIIRLTQK